MSYDSCDTCGEARLLAVDRCEPCDDQLRARLAEVERERDDARLKLTTLHRLTCEGYVSLACERDEAMAAADAWAADMHALAQRCGQTEDEYPRKAIERVLDDRQRAEAELERLRAVVEAAREYVGNALGVGHVERLGNLRAALAALDAKG